MLYFIVNLSSKNGKGKLLWKQIRSYLKENHIACEAHRTEYAGHATILAKEFCARIEGGRISNPCIIIVGGDGTVNEVVSGITDFSKVRVGVIPNGSGNDFARGVGIGKDPMKNLLQILEAYKNGEECYRPLDLGEVELCDLGIRRTFAISSGVGMDAIVTDKVNNSNLKRILNHVGLGKLSYILMTVYTLFAMKTADYDTEFTDALGETVIRHYPKCIFTAGMNMRAEGGGVPMAPGSLADDRLLSMCVAYGIPKWVTFFCLPILMLAKHEKIKGFEIQAATECHMKLSIPTMVHADGEGLGESADIRLKVLPGILHFLG